METLTQQPMAQQVTLRGWSALADGWFSLHSDPDVSIVDSHESIHWSWDIDGVTFCSPSLCHWNLCPGGGLIRLYTTTRVMECYHLIKKTTKLNNSLLPGVDVDSSPRCNNMRLPGFKVSVHCTCWALNKPFRGAGAMYKGGTTPAIKGALKVALHPRVLNTRKFVLGMHRLIKDHCNNYPMS